MPDEFTPTTICSNCWYENGRAVYNINGRCDSCGGTDFIEHGIDPDTTKELERPEHPEEYDPDNGSPDDTYHDSISSRDKVRQQIDDMREKKYPNPLRRSGFFKD